jgi:hypothetical protein
MAITDFVGNIPVIGGLAKSAGMETSETRAAKAKQKAIEQVMLDLQAYRPEMIQTRQNSIDNAMKLFQPMNNALVKAYGSGAALPLAEASKSPYSDQAMAAMTPAGIKAKADAAKDPKQRALDDWWTKTWG